MVFGVRSIRTFVKIHGDPYYEPTIVVNDNTTTVRHQQFKVISEVS